MANVTVLPKPEVNGVGLVRYRCSLCDELMDPADAVIVEDCSYHPEHAPKEDDDGS